MASRYEGIWYATPKRISQMFKWCTYEDVGTLVTDEGSLVFQGKHVSLALAATNQISLIRQPVPWLNMSLSVGLVVAMTSSGLMTFFTWENPATIPFLIVLFLFYFIAAGPVQWVEIRYVDNVGDARKAYFLNGSGMSRFFGGTRRFCDELRASALPARTNPA